MTVLDKYTKEELVHIVDMFRIDMKMEDLRKSKKDILAIMRQKKVDKKHGDKLPSKTDVKSMVAKDKKNPRSSLSKLAKEQKKITDFKKKPDSKNDKGGAKPPEKKATKFDKGVARIGASRLRTRLADRFDAQAKKKEASKKTAPKKEKVKAGKYELKKSEANKITTGSIKDVKSAGLDIDDVSAKADKPVEIIKEFGSSFWQDEIKNILEKKNPEFKDLSTSEQDKIIMNIFDKQIAPIIKQRDSKGKGLILFK